MMLATSAVHGLVLIEGGSRHGTQFVIHACLLLCGRLAPKALAILKNPGACF